VDLAELRELIAILEDSSLSEIEIEEEGHRVRVRKEPPPVIQMASAMPGTAVAGGAVAPAAAVEKTAAEEALESGLETINSPMGGTYYVAPAPGEPPFVVAGDSVDAGQTVCIVEAMKIMNEVAAKLPAVIVKVLVENGDPIEFDQPLFAVRPL
jgi:acetyl-CoA carboxylase biotin carboxyl carrier protein